GQGDQDHARYRPRHAGEIQGNVPRRLGGECDRVLAAATRGTPNSNSVKKLLVALPFKGRVGWGWCRNVAAQHQAASNDPQTNSRIRSSPYSPFAAATSNYPSTRLPSPRTS